ncbi:hypothetical protein SRHO_G00254700 [Serrasalmus rhombeus]
MNDDEIVLKHRRFLRENNGPVWFGPIRNAHDPTNQEDAQEQLWKIMIGRTPPFFCRETPQSQTASDSCHSTHSNTSRSSRLNEGKQTKELQSAEMRRQDHRRTINFA